MKISKLFHWLYAVVMMLPIFAIGSALLVSTFNQKSKEETEIHYKYETNDVSSNDDIVVGRAYGFETTENVDYLTWLGNKDFEARIIEVYESNFDMTYNSVDEEWFFDIACDGDFIGAINDNYIYFYWGDDAYVSYEITQQDLYIRALVVVDTYDMYDNSYFQFSGATLQDLPIDFVDTHDFDAKDVFYDSVEKVKTSPLFSWAYNSFLSEPIQYIMVLFSVPSNHVIVELLAYWLAVSIIWLVFDLIMYVPLMAHRWLDKGIVE